MFDDTITLFNRYHSKLGDVWYKHELTGCQLKRDKASITATYGEKNSDSAMLHILWTGTNDEKVVKGLPYLPPKEWANQVNSKLGNSITFNDDATNFDFFIVGTCNAGATVNDDDYTDGFYNYMNRRLDYCYAITGVAVYSAIPHFEIMAR